MTDDKQEPYGDPLTQPFWDAAGRHELWVQRCTDCGHHQFYPRPFCLACSSNDVAWTEASGFGTVYSQTTVRVQVIPELEPRYVVAIITLEEGPRITAGVVGETIIGQAVRVNWRERDGLPPLPVFGPSDRE